MKPDPAQISKQNKAALMLDHAATAWFAVAVLGQLIFVVYIVAFYSRGVIAGDLALWNKVLAAGYEPGNTMGNTALAIHLLLAAVITIAGPLQLIPQVRAKVPQFHRWSGRVYMATAVIMSLTGLYLIWVKGGVVGGVVQHTGTSLNALAILLFSYMATRYAMAGKFGIHRRWAIRLYLAVSGVWFFRVGLLFWLIVNKGPVGFNPKTFLGPFLDFLTFAQLLIPIAVLEVYFRVQQKAGANARFAFAGTLMILTLAMGVGIFGATMGMWLPRI
jgi:hypothetical protein